jgi:hypothetical protein
MWLRIAGVRALMRGPRKRGSRSTRMVCDVCLPCARACAARSHDHVRHHGHAGDARGNAEECLRHRAPHPFAERRFAVRPWLTHMRAATRGGMCVGREMPAVSRRVPPTPRVPAGDRATGARVVAVETARHARVRAEEGRLHAHAHTPRARTSLSFGIPSAMRVPA